MTEKPRTKKYDLSILRLINTITAMTPEERVFVLKEMEKLTKKIKLRATRRKCNFPIEIINSRGVHTAVVENISFTGAFIACRVPVLIDEKVILHFRNGDKDDGFKLPAKIMRSTPWGFGVEFMRLDSQGVRVLQAYINDLPVGNGSIVSFRKRERKDAPESDHLKNMAV